MIKIIQPQLMFTGSAKEAMELYVNIFKGEILDEQLYPSDHPTQAGQVLRAIFKIGDQEIACIDSLDVHGFTFTPSMSLFVELSTSAELERIFDNLSSGGNVLMPIANYGFSESFAWFNDKFGVSWQLNFAGTNV